MAFSIISDIGKSVKPADDYLSEYAAVVNDCFIGSIRVDIIRVKPFGLITRRSLVQIQPPQPDFWHYIAKYSAF